MASRSLGSRGAVDTLKGLGIGADVVDEFAAESPAGDASFAAGALVPVLAVPNCPAIQVCAAAANLLLMSLGGALVCPVIAEATCTFTESVRWQIGGLPTFRPRKRWLCSSILSSFFSPTRKGSPPWLCSLPINAPGGAELS